MAREGRHASYGPATLGDDQENRMLNNKNNKTYIKRNDYFKTRKHICNFDATNKSHAKAAPCSSIVRMFIAVST
jgi:hypothetical protein